VLDIIGICECLSILNLEDKRILVIGGGNSACDVAVEAARFAKESHSSMRRGHYFFPRTIAGIPVVDIINPLFPLWFTRFLLRVYLAMTVGSNKKYGLLEPDHKIFEQHPTINSEFLNYIRLGKIKPHPGIERAYGKKVVFVDGSEEEIDMIVCATGYHLRIPFLDNILEYKDGVPQLYNLSIHPKYRNIFIFGIAQVRYGAGSLICHAAVNLSKMILIQDRLIYSLGKLLEKSRLGKIIQRTKESPDIIVDPFISYNGLKGSLKLIPYFPTIEKILIKLKILK